MAAAKAISSAALNTVNAIEPDGTVPSGEGVARTAPAEGVARCGSPAEGAARCGSPAEVIGRAGSPAGVIGPASPSPRVPSTSPHGPGTVSVYWSTSELSSGTTALVQVGLALAG